MTYLLPTLPKNATNEDKVFAAISDFTGRILCSVASESKVYSFKCADGTLHTIRKSFIDEISGI